MKRWLLLRSMLLAAVFAAVLIVAAPGWAESCEPPPPPCEAQPESSLTLPTGFHLTNSWKWGRHHGRSFRGQEEAPPPCPPAEEEIVPQGPPRAGYCSVTGNTYPDGRPIPVGTFLDLELRQVTSDANYEGAVPAIFVEGKGLTCDPPPAGFSFDGSTLVDPLGEANGTDGAIYPFYKVG
jgi:hypothetical protein